MELEYSNENSTWQRILSSRRQFWTSVTLVKFVHINCDTRKGRVFATEITKHCLGSIHILPKDHGQAEEPPQVRSSFFKLDA